MMIEYDRRFDECIFDLTWYAVDFMHEYGKYTEMMTESRNLFRYIFDIANEFLYECTEDEQAVLRNDDIAYILKIHDFAMCKLKEYFGIDPEDTRCEQTEISIREEPEG